MHHRDAGSQRRVVHAALPLRGGKADPGGGQRRQQRHLRQHMVQRHRRAPAGMRHHRVRAETRAPQRLHRARHRHDRVVARGAQVAHARQERIGRAPDHRDPIAVRGEPGRPCDELAPRLVMDEQHVHPPRHARDG
jgi:hypothetical protein